MNTQEKALARIMFKSKIHEADGQKFEDMFTKLMTYAEPDFQPIKPWGNIGDRKNDGYIKTKGIFYQVYSPEDVSKHKTYLTCINKLEDDFHELLKHWNPVKEFYFVLNDKYKGVNADCELKLESIKKEHELQKAGFKTPAHLEKLLFSLSDDQIIQVAGFLPDPKQIKVLDFSALSQVVGFIMKLPLPSASDSTIKVPDWDSKIKFNKLSEMLARCLDAACLHLGALEEFLKDNTFLAEQLMFKMRELYESEEASGKKGDELFLSIINKASPSSERPHQEATIVIMAKYFESCDIFEDPEDSDK